MQNFAGRVAVVTGAASGIGLGLARRFLNEGMKVVLADIDQAALDNAAASLSPLGELIAIRTDVSKISELEALAESDGGRSASDPPRSITLTAGIAPRIG